MVTEVKKLGKSTVEFEIEISGENFEAAIEKAYRVHGKKINVPGFRRGKAPRALIEKFYGEDFFYEDAINIVLPSAYDKAVDELKIQPLLDPEYSLKTVDRQNGAVLLIKVVVRPELKLGKYKGIEIDKIEYSVTEEDIDEEIDKLRDRNARLISVDDARAQLGDTLTIDIERSVEGETSRDEPLMNHKCTLGSGKLIKEFEANLIDKKIDEDISFDLVFPADYPEEKLRNQTVNFKVKINQIHRKELAELDDEFAIDVSETAKNLEELRLEIREKLEKSNQQKQKNELLAKILEKIADGCEMEIPEFALKNAVKRALGDAWSINDDETLELLAQRFINWSGDEDSDDDTVEKFKDDLLRTAEIRIKLGEIIPKLIEIENIQATPEEIEKQRTEINSGVGAISKSKDDNLSDEVLARSVKSDKLDELLIREAIVK